nr:hypothetical protein [Methanothermus fervidus]
MIPKRKILFPILLSLSFLVFLSRVSAENTTNLTSYNTTSSSLDKSYKDQ